MWRRGGDWEGVWSLEWDWLEEENEGVLQGTGVASFNERANQKFREKTNINTDNFNLATLPSAEVRLLSHHSGVVELVIVRVHGGVGIHREELGRGGVAGGRGRRGIAGRLHE